MKLIEGSSKRRDWVKNAAIIFLVILLILTFFSNTILNYSLPEVAVQYVQSGSITPKVRGTGSVESGDPYQVILSESRVIRSVEVYTGDVVEEGQVLFTLEEGDSNEVIAQQEVVSQLENMVQSAQDNLEAKNKQIEDAVLQLELQLLAGNISESVYQAAQSGNVSSMATYRTRILEAEAIIQNMQPDIDWYETKIRELQAAVDGSDTTVESNNFSRAFDAYNMQNDQLVSKQTQLSALVAAYENAQATLALIGGDPLDDPDAEQILAANASIEAYNAQFNDLNNAISNLTTTVATLYTNYQTAQQVLYAKQANLVNLSNELSNRKSDLSLLKANQDEAIAAKEKLLSDISSELNLSAQQGAINDLRNDLPRLQDAVEEAQEKLEDAQEKLDELESKEAEASVTAPISGTITSINVTSGNTAQAGMALATMQPRGKGYTMSFSVTAQQASRLNVGMVAELVNAWRYDDVSATLTKIMPDPSNPSAQRILTFDVVGSILSGQSLTLSVGDKSSQYDLLVPKSAIREDNNGSFILIVESRNTPISTRYIAKRVDVEVVASDDTLCAITGGLYGYEYVITTATSPVEAGQQVRLADN
ncbi:MAG: HlyD family efflux transporter periplasmic adaptor subunit [Clostridium sp.]|jgi:RND family efflux transporter MFP subunit|nr:HlyD family efflux transporter periplasmic adaptor subunit [Clostridium sp.]